MRFAGAGAKEGKRSLFYYNYIFKEKGGFTVGNFSKVWLGPNRGRRACNIAGLGTRDFMSLFWVWVAG